MSRTSLLIIQMNCAQFVFVPFPFSYLFAWTIHIFILQNTGLPRLASVNQQKISCASLLKIQIWIPHKYFASCLALAAKMMHIGSFDAMQWTLNIFWCRWLWLCWWYCCQWCKSVSEDFREYFKELTGVWENWISFMVNGHSHDHINGHGTFRMRSWWFLWRHWCLA